MGEEGLAHPSGPLYYTGLGFRLETNILLSTALFSISIASPTLLNDDTTGGEEPWSTSPSTGTVSHRLNLSTVIPF